MGGRQRLLLGGALAAALVVGVLIGALVFGGDDGGGGGVAESGPSTTPALGASTTTEDSTTPTTGSSTAATIPVEGLDGDARAFAEALNAASAMNYHARYEGQGTAQDGTPTEMVVEVWRRLPLARRDVTISGQGGRFASREYRTSQGMMACLNTSADGSGEFQCTSVPTGGTDPSAAAFGAVDPHAGPVTVTSDSVGGVDVRCYRVTPSGANTPNEVCFDEAGIPVVVDDADVRLVRSVVDVAVTDADLAPPTSGG